MSYRVLSVETTPNPNAMKFVLDRAISERPASFFNADAAAGNAIAQRLFAINGVASLLFLNDFVTVNKTAAAQWMPIKDAVRKALADG